MMKPNLIKLRGTTKGCPLTVENFIFLDQRSRVPEVKFIGEKYILEEFSRPICDGRKEEVNLLPRAV